MRSLNIFQLTLIWLLLSLILALSLRLMQPIHAKAVAWQPQPAPSLTGIWHNLGLLDARIKPLTGEHEHFDAFSISEDGRFFGALPDGRIITWLEGTAPETFAQMPKSLETIHWDSFSGSLLASQSSPTEAWQIGIGGQVKHIALQENGTKFHAFASDAAGGVYATELSRKWSSHSMIRLTLEHTKDGSAYHWSANVTKKPQVMLSGLAGATGLTPSPNADYLLVLESSEYRVWRVWLTGARRGQKEVLLDNLPGFLTSIAPATLPSNTSLPQDRDYFWLSIPTTRAQTPVPDRLAGSGWIRNLMLNLPTKWYPKQKTSPFLVLFDNTGKVHFSLQASERADLPGFKQIKQQGNKLILLPSPIDTSDEGTARQFAPLYELIITNDLIGRALAKTQG